MPRAKMVREAAYEAQLMEIPSDKTVVRIEEIEDQLAVFPDMGSPVVRDALVLRFGPNLRKVVVDGYVLVYRHDEDAVRMLAAVPGKSVL